MALELDFACRFVAPAPRHTALAIPAARHSGGCERWDIATAVLPDSSRSSKAVWSCAIERVAANHTCSCHRRHYCLCLVRGRAIHPTATRQSRIRTRPHRSRTSGCSTATRRCSGLAPAWIARGPHVTNEGSRMGAHHPCCWRVRSSVRITPCGSPWLRNVRRRSRRLDAASEPSESRSRTRPRRVEDCAIPGRS